ncbi:MAG: response regulator [Verrucomicrobiae bacterium]|nr:response regulator [Verrucomicrobiae bacterium]
MNRILIASGDQTTAEGVQYALSSAGYQTAVIADSQQLMAFCGQHTPDLTVIDLDLPGSDVLSAAQAIRSETRLQNMPLIGLAGPVSDAEREQAKVCGFSALESKPLNLPNLVNTVQTALNSVATNITPMPAPKPAPVNVDVDRDPVGVLLRQTSEIRTLTADLKPAVATYGEEAPELFGYIENSGNQIQNELDKLAEHGMERSAVALQDKDLRHDFRNMIGSVTGFSELLLMESGVHGEAREKFIRIREICREFCEILDQQKAAAA